MLLVDKTPLVEYGHWRFQLVLRRFLGSSFDVEVVVEVETWSS